MPQYRHNLLQKFASEVVGTFLLTFASVCTAVDQPQATPDLTHVLAPALVVLSLVYALGNVSGAHFNPIVSVAFWLRRSFPGRLVPPYVVAQVAGGTLGALVASSVLGDVSKAVTAPHLALDSAFLTEALLSAALVTVILGVSSQHRLIGAESALPVAAMITVCGLIGDPLTGASMNPARSIGPAVVSGHWYALWLYCAAPLAGSVFAVGLTALMHSAHHRDEREAATGK